MRVVAGSPSAEDVAAISALIQALYRWISGPAGPRDPMVLRAMFCPEGRLAFSHDLGGSWKQVTPAEFTTEVNLKLETAGFYELQLSATLSAFGVIAHVFSIYESRRAPAEPAYARGVNSIELVKQAGEWRVLSMCWDQERAGNPLP
jgi:hypothetical protein